VKSKQKLEVVNSDVRGTFEVKSLGGNCYFLTVVYEFIRYMWIYLIQNQNEEFTQFKRFKLRVRKQVECIIKKLGTDGGGEYIST